MPGKGEIAVQGEAETEPVESLGLGHAPFAGMTYLRVPNSGYVVRVFPCASVAIINVSRDAPRTNSACQETG